jgi:hypothetical protein
LTGDTFALLHCLPAASRRRQWVHGGSDALAIDAKELFEIRDLAAKACAVAKSFEDVRRLNHSFVSAKEGGKRILLLEIVGNELAEVAAKQAGELVEFEAGHRAVAQFHLSNRRARHAKMLRDVILRESPCCACQTKPPPKLLATHGHLL